MKLAVVGSRGYKSKEKVFKILDEINKKKKIKEIVSGGAPGVDSWAVEWAKENSVDIREFYADWNNLDHPDALIKTHKYGHKYDARAGIRRNSLIIDHAEKVIAFLYNNSRGTMDSIRKAKKAGKLAKVFD